MKIDMSRLEVHIRTLMGTGLDDERLFKRLGIIRVGQERDFKRIDLGTAEEMISSLPTWSSLRHDLTQLGVISY